MAGNKVELCGVNTAKLPLLKEEEKEELLARIKEGDEDAREQYIKGNLRLVIRVSRSLRDTAYKAIYAKEGFVKKYSKEPTVQEIAEEIGISKEDIVFALDAIQMPVSLHEPVYSDGGDTLYIMDQVSDKKNREENWVEELSLEAAMERLNERERFIIQLRFFEGKTQMEVSRLEKNALKIMKQYLLG